jgi:hypothetical protein
MPHKADAVGHLSCRVIETRDDSELAGVYVISLFTISMNVYGEKLWLK